MHTLAIAFEEGIDAAALEGLFAAVVLAIGVTGSPRFLFREVATLPADHMRVRRWETVEGRSLAVELIDDRSLALVWASVEGPDADLAKSVDQRLRSLLPACPPEDALRDAVDRPADARLLHRAVLAQAGRGAPPELLRLTVQAAIESKDRDRIFAACVASAQLKDEAIYRILKTAADADPGLRQIVDASVR